MSTLAILVGFGLAFAVFALLGPGERFRTCDNGRPGDPKCEHCPLDEVGEGGPFEVPGEGESR